MAGFRHLGLAGLRYLGLAGLRHLRMAGLRYLGLAGLRHLGLAGLRYLGLAGLRNNSIAGLLGFGDTCFLGRRLARLFHLMLLQLRGYSAGLLLLLGAHGSTVTGSGAHRRKDCLVAWVWCEGNAQVAFIR
jgi:hypothetical protein